MMYIKLKLFLFKLYYKILMFNRSIDMDKIYTDQNTYKNLYISTFYLPYGIKQMDKEYSERISNLNNNKENVNKLIKEIKQNPHLHKIIKYNLIYNINI